VFVRVDQFGTDSHASTLAVGEEFWIQQVVNVFVLQEIGMGHHASSVKILKSGVLLDYHASVLLVVGME